MAAAETVAPSRKARRETSAVLLLPDDQKAWLLMNSILQREERFPFHVCKCLTCRDGGRTASFHAEAILLIDGDSSCCLAVSNVWHPPADLPVPLEILSPFQPAACKAVGFSKAGETDRCLMARKLLRDIHLLPNGRADGHEFPKGMHRKFTEL